MMRKPILTIGAVIGFAALAGTAQANLLISPGTVLNSANSPACPATGTGSCVATAQPESGATFPLNSSGYTDMATLKAVDPGWYQFSYMGAGDAVNTNTFTVGTHSLGNHGQNTTPFELYFNAGDQISFSLTSMAGGSTTCSINSGGAPSPVPPDTGCSYLIAIDGSPLSWSPLTKGTDAFIGFSNTSEDRSASVNGSTGAAADYQDLVIKVTEIPEPASMALLGVSLAGLGIIRRRKTG